MSSFPIPIAPLHGSLSASGDLMPLVYMDGAIQGKSDIYARINGNRGPPGTITAKKALEQFPIEPVTLGAKEELGFNK